MKRILAAGEGYTFYEVKVQQSESKKQKQKLYYWQLQAAANEPSFYSVFIFSGFIFMVKWAALRKNSWMAELLTYKLFYNIQLQFSIQAIFRVEFIHEVSCVHCISFYFQFSSVWTW